LIIGLESMEFITDFYLFLASVILISLSGVMAPGPLFAVTIDKASKHKTAGPLIAFGHGIIEFPLMFVIYFGLTQYVVPEFVQISVGLIGGLVMILMGVQLFRNRTKTNEEQSSSKHGSLIAGIIATGANPYFIVWWITIGAALVMNAKIFGVIGFAVFAVTHWLCDFLWYTVVATAIFKSRRFWTKRVHQAIFLFCFAILVGFGAWFFSSALWLAVNTLV
jgi:threonine/homoserine/homoserine lactone efflux protein